MLKLLGLSGILLLPNIVRGQTEECPLQGTIPSKHTGSHNYVIDLFSGLLRFPFAINQCTQTDLNMADKWYKYTCDDDNSAVTKIEYTDADCSGNGTLMSDWVVDKEDFECGGMSSFVELQVSTDSDCNQGITVFAAVASCVSGNADLGQYQFYCNSSHALLEFYRAPITESTFLPTDIATSEIIETTELLETSELLETTELPISTAISATSTAGATSTSTAGATSTSVSSTSTSNIATTSTAGNLGRAITPTEFLSTWVATLMEQDSDVCDDSAYCNAWLLSRRACTRADLAVSQGSTTPIYGQMKRCQLRSFETTLPGKSSSIRPHLTISGLILLLLFALFY